MLDVLVAEVLAVVFVDDVLVVVFDVVFDVVFVVSAKILL